MGTKPPLISELMPGNLYRNQAIPMAGKCVQRGCGRRHYRVWYGAIGKIDLLLRQPVLIGLRDFSFDCSNEAISPFAFEQAVAIRDRVKNDDTIGKLTIIKALAHRGAQEGAEQSRALPEFSVVGLNAGSENSLTRRLVFIAYRSQAAGFGADRTKFDYVVHDYFLSKNCDSTAAFGKLSGCKMRFHFIIRL